MKTILVFSLLLAVTLAGNRREEIKEAVTACGGENDGPNELGKQILKENADQAKLGAITFCVHKKLGIQNDHGDIDVDVIRKDLNALIKDESEVNKIVEECGKRNGDTPEAAAFNFFKCYQKHVTK